MCARACDFCFIFLSAVNLLFLLHFLSQILRLLHVFIQASSICLRLEIIARLFRLRSKVQVSSSASSSLHLARARHNATEDTPEKRLPFVTPRQYGVYIDTQSGEITAGTLLTGSLDISREVPAANPRRQGVGGSAAAAEGTPSHLFAG